MARKARGAAQVLWEWALGIGVFVFCWLIVLPWWMFAEHQATFREAIKVCVGGVGFTSIAYGAFQKRRAMGQSGRRRKQG